MSIKTVTGLGHGSIKVLWTVDQAKIDQEIEKYQPEYDLFLVTIHWGKTRDSIFYIPTSVQFEIYEMFGDEYLNAKPGTNHRGIFINTEAVKAMKLHPDTVKCEVTWTKQEMHYTPYQRWEDFWKNGGISV